MEPLSLLQTEAQVFHYGVCAGLVSFFLAHLIGWITGLGRSGFNSRL